jgi:hypothetical protein
MQAKADVTGEFDTSQLHACLPTGSGESHIQGIQGMHGEEAATDSAPSTDLLTPADLEDFFRMCTERVRRPAFLSPGLLQE